MKVLSYNIFCVKEDSRKLPWDLRQKNLRRILNEILADEDIKVCCFQEVNKLNLTNLQDILSTKGFVIPKKFAMKTDDLPQYNIVAVKKNIKVKNVFCLPHGKDKEYKPLKEQAIDYEMSDYRTTIFVEFEYNNKTYCVGNIHTDYISIEGKIRGSIKSLDYLDKNKSDYKFVVGDMNMVPNMAEAWTVFKYKDNYRIIDGANKFNAFSYHGYKTECNVNADWAFVPKATSKHYKYSIIKQKSLALEGSDHRPILIEIKD